MSLHVCPKEMLTLDSHLAKFMGKKLFFWLSACNVVIVVPFLEVRPTFPLVSWTEGVR